MIKRLTEYFWLLTALTSWLCVTAILLDILTRINEVLE